ncbi:YCF48-related protein [uncultured Kordia sp.]|uniref:WD40/YVTN/BNR-like repeat-containing protein n=1 Tax=uncultured Kordia sp. TaxID=507699 RepID=UPI00261FAA95|nr:YCF48-related protein [uncultured Kordia sp.]
MKNILYFCFLILIFSCSQDDSSETVSPMLWSELNSPTSKGLSDIKFINENFGVICGSLNALFKTEDGGETWEELDVGIPTSLNTVFILNENEFLTSRVGLHKTTDGGITFNEIGGLENYSNTIFHIHFFTEQNGIIVKGGTVLKTNDGGANWVVAYSNTQYASELVVTTNETIYLAGGTTYDNVSLGSLYKSTDNGINWQQLELPESIRNVEISATEFVNENYGFIGMFDRNIYKTTDGGASWAHIASGFTDGFADIHFINEQEGYLLSRNKIYKTINGGVSWNLEYEHEDINIYLRSITSTSNGKLYAVGKNGLILKRDE